MGILRYILAISVLLYHVPQKPILIMNGAIAVEAFFIISGFYMALVINEKYSKLTNWHYSFYSSRLLRLLPSYLVVCLATYYLYVQSDTVNIFSASLVLTPQSLLTLKYLNIFILGQDIWQMILEHFSHTNPPNIILDGLVSFFGKEAMQQHFLFVGQAWSLSTEIFFYLIAPFVVLSKKRTIFLFVVFLLIRFYFCVNVEEFPNSPWRSRFFIANYPVFLLGVFSYWIYLKARTESMSRDIGKYIYIIIITYTLYILYSGNNLFMFPGVESFDTFPLWIFYLLVTVSIPYLFIFTKQLRADKFVGELSYPIYLVHGVVIGQLYVGGLNLSSLNKILVIVFISTAISILLYMFVDRVVETKKWILIGSQSFLSQTITKYMVLGYFLMPLVIIAANLFVYEKPSKENSQPLLVPYLIKSITNYNLVKFGNMFYVIPWGVEVDWQSKRSLSNPVIKGFSSEAEAKLYVDQQL